MNNKKLDDWIIEIAKKRKNFFSSISNKINEINPKLNEVI